MSYYHLSLRYNETRQKFRTKKSRYRRDRYGSRTTEDDRGDDGRASIPSLIHTSCHLLRLYVGKGFTVQPTVEQELEEVEVLLLFI